MPTDILFVINVIRRTLNRDCQKIERKKNRERKREREREREKRAQCTMYSNPGK